MKRTRRIGPLTASLLPPSSAISQSHFEAFTFSEKFYQTPKRLERERQGGEGYSRSIFFFVRQTVYLRKEDIELNNEEEEEGVFIVMEMGRATALDKN